MRPIDGDALEEAFYQKMKELLKSTDTPQISNEALSLLCGASLITKAPTIEPDIERINNSVDEYISRKSVTVGLDYIINELNKLITDDSPDDGYTDIKNQVEEIKRGVLNIPPEDVQPVVRCRNCEHWDDMYGTCYCEDFEVHCQDYYIGDMHTEPDFFCGFGERGRRRQ